MALVRQVMRNTCVAVAGARQTRRVLLVAGVVAGAALVAGCGSHARVSGSLNDEDLLSTSSGSSASPSASALGRLTARPGVPTTLERTRFRRLSLGNERDGLLYVGAGYQPERPAPLALLLHGAGGSADSGLTLLRDLADDRGLILLAPDSRDGTWDVIVNSYGSDIAFIDSALAQVFGRFNVDPARVGIGGFSDGASYALSVGLMNGDLFTHLLAFSPGFSAPLRQIGRPRIFVSHGTRDEVLPIDSCSRVLVPELRSAGYDVTYREFDGPHTVPDEIKSAAVQWFAPAT
jgi:phospholipase/carboxylesterase